MDRCQATTTAGQDRIQCGLRQGHDGLHSAEMATPTGPESSVTIRWPY